MRPDLLPRQMRTNLKRLVDDSNNSHAALSRMLGRYDSYLATFVREGVPEKLRDAEIGRLARFFDVEAWELGGPGERRGNLRPDQQGVRSHQSSATFD